MKSKMREINTMHTIERWSVVDEEAVVLVHPFSFSFDMEVNGGIG